MKIDFTVNCDNPAIVWTIADALKARGFLVKNCGFMVATKEPDIECDPPIDFADNVPDGLIPAMAMAVGKSLAAYVEVMYPEAVKAASSTFKLSIRNHIYNDIMHVSTLHTEAEIRAWLESQEAFRKQWLAGYRKLRRESP